MTTIRRLAAILAADITGYSAATERHEEGTANAIRTLRRDVIDQPSPSTKPNQVAS